MKLNNEDYKKIADNIYEGSHRLELHKENNSIQIEYSYVTDGYIEDDERLGYMNGTGGYIETYRCLSIDTAESTDSEGNISAVDVDERLLESLVA